MNKYTVMPLLNSSFEPGKAREIVAGFEDMDVRNIAQAELFYFMGEAESSSEIAERYLTSEIMELRLSASMIYGYSNMTLGNLVAVQRGLEEIQECLKLAMRRFPRKHWLYVFLRDMQEQFFFIFQRMEFLHCGNTAVSCRKGCDFLLCM